MSWFRTTESEEWEHFVSSSFYSMSLDSVAERFTATARFVELGRGVRIAEMQPAPSGLARSSRLVRSQPSDDVLFLMQLSGRARLEQAGQQLELHAGQAAYCDPAEPYTIVESGGEQIVTTVPRASVLPARMNACDIRLHRLHMTRAPLRVFRLLAEEVTSDAGDDQDRDRDAIAGAAIELLRSAAVMASPINVDGRPWSRETHLRVIKEFLLAHLSDPTLTMERVASVNGISVRQLSIVFQPDDSPAAFLRRERLKRARDDLSDLALVSVPISEIAARWGFLDSSTFGRAFRRAYGETPTGLRGRAMHS